WQGAPIPVAIGIAGGNTLEAVFAAIALSRFGFRNSIERLRDALVYAFIACAAAPLISATIGVLCLYFGSVVTADRFAETWRAWWFGDALGALIVGPLLLTWSSATRAPRERRELELVALLVATVAAAANVFTNLDHWT